MTTPVDPILLDLAACPACGGTLEVRACGEELACRACGARYEVRGGIPVLLPPGFDRTRLAQEEHLGDLMTGLPEEAKDPLSEREWKRSKAEFWEFVRGRLAPGGETIVSIGCGVDTAFLELGARHTALAFDLVVPLLETLRDRHGSKLNVAGAVQSLPLKDGVFDALCCIDLLHHDPDRLEEIVRSFHRVLRPGGRLFLEDVNAWGLLQMWKSPLPRPLRAALRSLWHRLRSSRQRPAPYEFPTSVFRTGRLLAEAGFEEITAVPQRAWPNTPRPALAACRALSRIPRIRRYHNFHYFLYAVKR